MIDRLLMLHLNEKIVETEGMEGKTFTLTVGYIYVDKNINQFSWLYQNYFFKQL